MAGHTAIAKPAAACAVKGSAKLPVWPLSRDGVPASRGPGKPGNHVAGLPSGFSAVTSCLQGNRAPLSLRIVLQLSEWSMPVSFRDTLEISGVMP